MKCGDMCNTILPLPVSEGADMMFARLNHWQVKTVDSTLHTMYMAKERSSRVSQINALVSKNSERVWRLGTGLHGHG